MNYQRETLVATLRQPVDQQRIELFLQRLGRQFTKLGRVYLVGGTTMVYEGLRQQTLDIDLAYDISNEDHSAFVADVLALLKSEKIEWEKLVQYFDEIMVRYATDSLKQAPDEFQDKFAIVGEMWREASASV